MYLSADGGTGIQGPGGSGTGFRQIAVCRQEPHGYLGMELRRLQYADGHECWQWNFKAGIAVAPPTDWKYYDSVYTERFMRTPKENFEGYAATSPIRLAKDLQGKLLLIHGTADDNVHFQQTMDYAESLVQAGKQFEMQVYKDRNHSIYGGNTRYHLYTRMSNFLFDNL